jgi:hypothetical protein
MADPQKETYTLFCVIAGEDTPFSIEIEKSKPVDVLKKAIKKENANTFANIDAAKLTLYLINIPADTELSKNVNERIKTITPAEALNPTDELSDLFSEAPAKKTVHILVRAPALGK